MRDPLDWIYRPLLTQYPTHASFPDFCEQYDAWRVAQVRDATNKARKEAMRSKQGRENYEKHQRTLKVYSKKERS